MMGSKAGIPVYALGVLLVALTLSAATALAAIPGVTTTLTVTAWQKVGACDGVLG